MPAVVPRGTVVDIYYGGKQALAVPAIDLGPWNTSDPYWRTGARPAAERGIDARGRRTNKAGIDLTPAVWAELLGKPADYIWARSPSAYVAIAVREPGRPASVYAAIALPDDATLRNQPVRDASVRLSDHFTVADAERSDTASAHGITNALPAALFANAQLVALRVLEPLVAALGPLQPNSWFRTPALNAILPGSSPTSAHMQALAVDLPRTKAAWDAVHRVLPSQGQGVLLQVEDSHYHLATFPAPELHLRYLAGVAVAAWEA